MYEKLLQEIKEELEKKAIYQTKEKIILQSLKTFNFFYLLNENAKVTIINKKLKPKRKYKLITELKEVFTK